MVLLDVKVSQQSRRDCRRHNVLIVPTCLIFLLLVLRVHFAQSWSRISQRPLRVLPQESAIRKHPCSSVGENCLWSLPRGGSSEAAAVDSDEEEEESEEEQSEEESEEDDKDDDKKKNDITSMAPLLIQIKTNWNNKLLDIPPLEVNAVRSRDMASIKKNLARQLPGKPPIEAVRLLHHGQLLRDDMIVDELMDNEEEDEDDAADGDDHKVALTLVLDMAPPVDHRFTTQLDEYLDDMTTSDLLQAYVINEAAIWFRSQYLAQQQERLLRSQSEHEGDEDEEEEEDEDEETTIPSANNTPLIGFQIMQYAAMLRQQLEATLPDKAKTELENEIPPSQAAAMVSREPQVKGQRVRPSPALADSSNFVPSSSVLGVKQTAQHYLNINWFNTIKNVVLFMFFGYFGGRTVTSRALLLLGAPLCFVVQARPVKVYIKQWLYALLRNPPTIVLSLLPAPQQAILSLTDEQALQLIYGDDASRIVGLNKMESANVNDDEEDEEDVIEALQDDDGEDEISDWDDEESMDEDAAEDTADDEYDVD